MEGKHVLENLKECYDQMFSAEKKVVDYIMENPEQVVNTNVSELAALSGVSDATVVRMCKHAGYEGYYQMKIMLSHDIGRNIAMRKADTKPKTVQELFQVFASDLMETAEQLSMETVMKCVDMLKQADYVHVVAAGNTTPVAEDFGFRLGRYGIKSTHSPIPEYYLNHVNMAGPDDVVFGISRSGSSIQVVQAFELARKKSLKTIVITTKENSPVSKLADQVLLINTSDRSLVDYGPVSHMNEIAVIDMLLYFILQKETFNVDNVELILSGYKM